MFITLILFQFITQFLFFVPCYRFEKNVTVYSPQPITTLAPKTKLWYTHKDFDSFEDSFDREREKDFEHDERV